MDEQNTLPDTEETLDYVTPYALSLHPTLFGKAIARPMKRLMALSIDGVVIVLIAKIPFIVAIAIFLFAFIKRHSKHAPGSSYFPENIRSRVIKVFQALLGLGVLLVVLLTGLVGAFYYLHDPHKPPMIWTSENAPKPLLEPLQNPDRPIENQVIVEPKQKQEDTEKTTQHSVIAWVQGILGDLGIGFGWAAMYFTVFTSGFNGRTLGKYLLGLRVVKLDNSKITFWDAFGRYGGYAAGISTGLLGFLQIYWDPNRQAIQDKIAATIVIDLKKPDWQFHTPE